MFFPNLNVFLACFILLGIFAAGPLFMIISTLLAAFGKAMKVSAMFIYPVGYLLPSAPLIFFWWKFNLSPAVRKPEREWRYRIGHWLVGLTNAAIIAALFLPFLLARFSGNPGLVMLAWFSLPVYAFGVFILMIGLFMIWSSRA